MFYSSNYIFFFLKYLFETILPDHISFAQYRKTCLCIYFTELKKEASEDLCNDGNVCVFIVI